MQDTSQLVRLGAIADQLERRTENLQDLQWQASERESRYRQLLDAQSDLILRVDHKRKLTFANKAFCEMFEVSQTDVLGQPFSPEVIEGKCEKAGVSPWFFDGQGPSEPVVQLISTPKGERWKRVRPAVMMWPRKQELPSSLQNAMARSIWLWL